MTDEFSTERYYKRAELASRILPVTVQMTMKPVVSLDPTSREKQAQIDLGRAISLAVDIADNILSAIAQKDAQIAAKRNAANVDGPQRTQ